MAEATNTNRVEIFRQLQRSIMDQVGEYVAGGTWMGHLPGEEDRTGVLVCLGETIESMFLSDDQRCADMLCKVLDSHERATYGLFVLMAMHVQAMQVYVDHCLMDVGLLLKRAEDAVNKL